MDHHGGMGMTHPAVNFLASQLGWFACVLGAAHGHPWFGGLLALVLIGLHLRATPDRRREASLIATAAAIGLVADTLLLNAGRQTYASPWPGGIPLAPLWIVVLWAQFATTLRWSLRWLLGRPLLATALGAAAGPLAFRAGEALGAVRFGPNRILSLVALGAVWAVALPTLSRLAGRGEAAKE